jgi:adenylate cyclase
MKRVEGLAFWLAENSGLGLPALHEAFCRELLARGVPLWRSVLGREMLHPEQSGQQLIWTLETSKATHAVHGVEYTSDYLLSPVRIIDETNRPFRRRLASPVPELPLLEEIRGLGGTDYAIWPLPFLDQTRSAFLSFATMSKSGFKDEDLEALRLAANLFSPYAERHSLRTIAIDLLDTYVGRHAGEQIFSGRISARCGRYDRSRILMCDMRGYTALSSRAARGEIIETLDAWFDRIEAAVEVNGGEILKFIGDGVLTIFRADPDAADACRRAHEATKAIAGSLAGFKPAGASEGQPAIGFAIGLHVGEVAYGNVGGRRRPRFHRAWHGRQLCKPIAGPCQAHRQSGAGLVRFRRVSARTVCRSWDPSSARHWPCGEGVRFDVKQFP